MLSDLMVRQAKATGKPYTLADFDGLALFVSANGAKARHFRFTWGGKRDRMYFGGYPALSLTALRTILDVDRAISLGLALQTRQIGQDPPAFLHPFRSAPSFTWCRRVLP